MSAAPREELLELLRAIKAEPEENTPKLALADWLQEQPGEADRARGEFLHRFVENNLLAKTDPARQDFGALVGLWNRYENEWAGSLKEVGFKVWATNHLFRWGLLFPALDGTRGTRLTAPRVAGTEQFAWVGGITLRATDPTFAPGFADTPLLDGLVALRLAPAEYREALLGRLADSPRAARLQELDVGGEVVTLGAVAGSPHLGGLRRLVARNTSLTGDELEALAGSHTLTGLRTLDLAGCDLGPGHARILADGPGLPALAELDLGPAGYAVNQLGDVGLTALSAPGPLAGRLRRLNVCQNGIEQPGVLSLCARPYMSSLTHLDLSANRVHSRGAAELANAPQLGTLEELNLCNAGVTTDGAVALAKSPHLSRIRRLDLTRNRIGLKAATALRDRFGAAVLLD